MRQKLRAKSEDYSHLIIVSHVFDYSAILLLTEGVRKHYQIMNIEVLRAFFVGNPQIS